jgi:hypothetical protein
MKTFLRKILALRLKWPVLSSLSVVLLVRDLFPSDVPVRNQTLFSSGITLTVAARARVPIIGFK